jgi:hypothetical protein
MSLTTTWKSNLLQSCIPQHYPDPNTYLSYVTSTASTHSSAALNHLDLAYKQYTSLPAHQQHEVWQIELTRAFASEKQKRKELEDRLENVMAEARQLNDQVEYLSRCQWPREMALWPPERKPVPSSIIKEMYGGALRSAKRRKTQGPSGTAEVAAHHPEEYDEDEEEADKRWDYDTLLSRWKKIVREDTIRKRGLTMPNTVPITPTPNSPLPVHGGGGPHTTNNHHNTPPSSSRATAITTTSTSAAGTTASPAVTRAHREDQHFEPWSKKPKFVSGEDCMIGIPISEKNQQQQQQQQGQSQRQRERQREKQGHGSSNLKDLVTESSTAAQLDGDSSKWVGRQNGGVGGYAYGNGKGS